MTIDYRLPTIAVIGLGYVGLPLAEAFAKSLKVIGFDADTQKVHQLNRNALRVMSQKLQWTQQTQLELITANC